MYHRVNGTYCCENEWRRRQLLRDEWGFDGLVVRDWGDMNDRVRALAAGLGLEIPASGGTNDARIVAAVRAGDLPGSVIGAFAREPRTPGAGSSQVGD